MINTTNMCVELYYWINTGVRPTTLSIKLQTQQFSEILLDVVTLNRNDWWRWFVKIPTTLSPYNNIIIEVQRDAVGGSKVTIDDLMIQDCDQFGKLNRPIYFSALVDKIETCTSV